MLIYYQLCGGSLLPQCCFGLFFFTVTLRRSLPNISYFNAHITADWFPCVSRGQWDTSATWFNTSVLFCNIFFSYSDGNIARRLMNSCTKQLLCSRMFADMWNRHMSGFLLWNWQAVNFTHVLGNFCKVRVNPDLLTSDDCCQILNRFRHSHHSRVTLAKTPVGKQSQQLVQVEPMPMRLSVSASGMFSRGKKNDQWWCLTGHTYGCAKESPHLGFNCFSDNN